MNQVILIMALFFTSSVLVCHTSKWNAAIMREISYTCVLQVKKCAVREACLQVIEQAQLEQVDV